MTASAAEIASGIVARAVGRQGPEVIRRQRRQVVKDQAHCRVVRGEEIALGQRGDRRSKGRVGAVLKENIRPPPGVHGAVQPGAKASDVRGGQRRHGRREAWPGHQDGVLVGRDAVGSREDDRQWRGAKNEAQRLRGCAGGHRDAVDSDGGAGAGASRRV